MGGRRNQLVNFVLFFHGHAGHPFAAPALRLKGGAGQSFNIAGFGHGNDDFLFWDQIFLGKLTQFLLVDFGFAFVTDFFHQ